MHQTYTMTLNINLVSAVALNIARFSIFFFVCFVRLGWYGRIIYDGRVMMGIP